MKDAKQRVLEDQVASIMWEAVIKVRNAIADLGGGNMTDFHKIVGNLIAAKVKGDKTGEEDDNLSALAGAISCLLRSDNFPLETKVLLQDDDGSIANVGVVVGMTPEETEEAALAFMVKEAKRMIEDDMNEEPPDDDEIRSQIKESEGTYMWGSAAGELMLRDSDENVIAFRQ